MIRSLKNLDGFTIAAMDGAIGKVKDVYFDDAEWAVRYLVIDTGTWLATRKVLISPLFITGVDWIAQTVEVTLSRERVKDSPDIDFDKPVSRQQEADFYRHYQAFGYRTGPFVWGLLPYPGAMSPGTEFTQVDIPDRLHDRVRRSQGEAEDAHLRSAKEVEGYRIQARDGGIGHVEDFLFDEETWLIELLVVDTRNWLPGREVMIPPNWIREVNWLDRSATVTVDREAIEDRPEYPDDLVAAARSVNHRVERGGT